MSKKKIGIISALIVLWLIIWYGIVDYNKTNSELADAKLSLLQAQSKIEQLKELSPIEIDEIDLKKAQLDSEKYAKLEAENKRLKEMSVWKTRCLKKKIVWEEKDCTNNLERYASYNLK